MRSATERSLKECKRRGFVAGVVERWIPVAGNWKQGKRVDLFGIIDVVAVSEVAGIIGLQSTTAGGHTAHIRALKLEPKASSLKLWLQSGGRFMVWSWGKRPSQKKDGSRGVDRWKLRQQEAVLQEGEVAFLPAVWLD
jgi:hypothetical protein